MERPTGWQRRRRVDRRARGAEVEALARDHLLAAGLSEVTANAGFRAGELDLVMRDGEVVVFVEVRYRRNADYGGGAASVDGRKRRKLIIAAQLFLATHSALASLPCRFDVVEASGDPPQMHWIRDAFRADEV